MCDRKAVIKNADMSEEMQQDAVDCATQALEKFNIEKVCSKYLWVFYWQAHCSYGTWDFGMLFNMLPANILVLNLAQNCGSEGKFVLTPVPITPTCCSK